MIVFETVVGVFACFFLATTLVLVKRFCDQLSSNGELIDSQGYLF